MPVSDTTQLSLFNGDEVSVDRKNQVSLMALSGIRGVGFVTVKKLCLALREELFSVFSLPRVEVASLLESAQVHSPFELAEYIQAQKRQLLDEAKSKLRIYQERKQISLIMRSSPLYPRRLANAPSPPEWLFVQGDPSVLEAPAIGAIVGTREPSEGGLEAARRTGVILVHRGAVVLSGLAEGIDAVGHEAAVDLGAPTIAVLGHGIDVVFPASTSGLRERIVRDGGAVISEYLPNDTYNRERFVERNRIQAAMSDVVAIIEGKAKSGTAHTFRFATGLGRPVFGACIEEVDNRSEHELLHEILKRGLPVFTLGIPNQVSDLNAYLDQYLPRSSANMGPGRMFSGVLAEVERIVRQYGPAAADFEWLLQHITRLHGGPLRD